MALVNAFLATRENYRPVTMKVKRVSPLTNYIKAILSLAAIVVIITVVVVALSYTVNAKVFSVDALTFNDIPLAVGSAGLGAVILSALSPVSFLEEFEPEVPEKKKKDKGEEKSKAKKPTPKKNKAATPRRTARRRGFKRPRRPPTRGLRRAPRRIRFLRGLFRVFFRK